MDYVAGFLFSGDREQVALVEKARPEWPQGPAERRRKIEAPDASPVAAMVREFEEAGLRVQGWEKFRGSIASETSRTSSGRSRGALSGAFAAWNRKKSRLPGLGGGASEHVAEPPVADPDGPRRRS